MLKLWKIAARVVLALMIITVIIVITIYRAALRAWGNPQFERMEERWPA